MKLVIVNEVLGDKDFQSIMRAVNYWVPQCQKSQTGWGTLFDSVEGITDFNKTYVEKSGESPFYLTERHSIRGDAGFHDWNDALKISYAYISLKYSRFVYGKFHYPTVMKAHKIGPLTFPQRIFGKFRIESQGLVTALLHEIFETIGDPQLANISGKMAGTTLDSKGRAIFIENCDPVARELIRWIDPLTKQDMAIPNFVYKSWFNLKAKNVQLDEMHLCHTPFEGALGGYYFQVLPDGRKVRVF